MVRVFACDGITGAPIDELTVSAWSGERVMSAGGVGSAAIPLDGSFSKAALRDLLLHRARSLRFETDSRVEYAGYITGRPYDGGFGVSVQLTDLWGGIFNDRGAWDHTAPNVEKWSQTVTATLAGHASAAVLRGRTGPALPPMGLPVTLSGFTGTPMVTRPYYGYHGQKVGDVLADLMDEGLDIYFEPRLIGNGDLDWIMRAGVGWTSGVQREFHVTSDDVVTNFREQSDATRVTNNARYFGEGSEVDMLARSERNTASLYPLLDRVTERKNVSTVGQLSALAAQDLVSYGAPTTQWDFDLVAGTPIDVGDTVRLWFDGHPWIADGFHDRRVVKVTVNEGATTGVSCQPTGGL